MDLSGPHLLFHTYLNAYAIEMGARQPRFEPQTVAYHKWHEIGPSQNLRIELVGWKLLLQRCAGMAPATTWATRPNTKTRPLHRHSALGHLASASPQNLIRNKHPPWTSRSCPSARAQINPNTWPPAPAPPALRRAAAHSDGGGAGPRPLRKNGNLQQ